MGISSTSECQWIDGKIYRKTMVFTSKYGGVPAHFPMNPILGGLLGGLLGCFLDLLGCFWGKRLHNYGRIHHAIYG